MSEWSNNTYTILGIQMDTSTPKKQLDATSNADPGPAEPRADESINDDGNSEPMADDSLNISAIEEQTSIQCTFCTYKTSNKSNFNKHKTNVKCSSNKPVPKSTKFICHHCSKEYKTQYGLSLHCKKHDNVFQYKCDTCQKGYNQMAQFKAHLVSHTRALGAKCNTCKEYFSTTGSLKRHQETCAGCTTSQSVDAFQCDKCNAEFSRKYSLLYHSRSAHDSYRYKCVQCEKGFLWRSSLKAHMKTHI